MQHHRRYPVFLPAVLTAAGMCTVSLATLLGEAASAHCQRKLASLSCFGWNSSILLALLLGGALLWYGFPRPERDSLLSALHQPTLGSGLWLGSLAFGCSLLAWSTLQALTMGCTRNWSFECSSHLVGAALLILGTVGCIILFIRWFLMRRRQKDQPSIPADARQSCR